MDHDGRDGMISRIICELGYDPNDVCRVRMVGAMIEIDVIDFADDDWPLVTRRHAIPAARRRPGRSAPSGVLCARL